MRHTHSYHLNQIFGSAGIIWIILHIMYYRDIYCWASWYQLMSPTLRPNCLLNWKQNWGANLHFFLIRNNGDRSSVLKSVYFPSASVGMCSYQSLTTKVAAPRDQWACLSVSYRECVHLWLCVSVGILVCLYFIELMLTQELTPPTKMLWISPSTSLYPCSSIHLFFSVPTALPSWLFPLGER